MCKAKPIGMREMSLIPLMGARSIMGFTYQIACQHIHAYRIDEKAEQLISTFVF
jgi:hypothetical protein